MNISVADLLHHKGHLVVTTHPDDTVHEAVTTMVALGVGSVVVVADDGTVCGLLSERDCLSRTLLEVRDPTKTRVSDVMGRDVVTVTPDHQVHACMALMTEHRTRHLVVSRGERLLGVVSQGDCVAHLCDCVMRENDELYAYIVGVPPR